MPRTTTKRTALVLAASVALPLLLLCSYVSSWALVPHALRRGWLTGATADRLYGTVFAPVVVYSQGGVPGATKLNEFYHWVNDEEEELYVPDMPR